MFGKNAFQKAICYKEGAEKKLKFDWSKIWEFFVKQRFKRPGLLTRKKLLASAETLCLVVKVNVKKGSLHYEVRRWLEIFMVRLCNKWFNLDKELMIASKKMIFDFCLHKISLWRWRNVIDRMGRRRLVFEFESPCESWDENREFSVNKWLHFFQGAVMRKHWVNCKRHEWNLRMDYISKLERTCLKWCDQCLIIEEFE